MDIADLPRRQLELSDVELHVVDVGDGPLVVLLHGFPDFWYSWRRQIPALVDAGYRVVAPDMRGYNLSGKPAGPHRYRIDLLVRDVAELISACGAERAAAVAGHDWGGAVAWGFASRHPELVERLIILNCPHPAVFAAALTSPRQLARSWYMAFFQLPWLPELALRAGGHAGLRRALQSGVTSQDSFTDADLERHVEAAAQPGGLTGGINYYRAMARAMWRRRGRMPAAARGAVDAPVLVVWGDKDPVLLPELAEPPASLAPHTRVVRFPDAGHWVHLDADDAVNAEILKFLDEGG